jgi:hypothetical protein
MFDPSRRSLLSAAPGLALLAAGCPAVDPKKVGKALKQFLPTVRFDKVELGDINWKKADLRFQFLVDNPAPLKVGLASFRYALALEGVPLFEGDNPDGVTLKPEGTAPLVFPFTMKWDALGELLDKTRGRDELGFVLDGDLGFNTPVGVAPLPYRAAGNVPALRKPNFNLQGIKVLDFKPLQNLARIGIDIDVTNLGGSIFSFSGFDYGLSFGGNRVAGGVVERLGQVGADATERLRLPVDLSLLGVGATVIDAISKKSNLATKLDAQLKVGTPFGDIPLSIDETGRLQIS